MNKSRPVRVHVSQEYAERIKSLACPCIPVPFAVLTGGSNLTRSSFSIVLVTLIANARTGGPVHISLAEFAKAAGCTSLPGISNELNELIRRGLLSESGRGRAAKYEVVLERFADLVAEEKE